MENKYRIMASAAALHTASNTPQTCVYCDSPSHKPENCSDTTVTARKEKLKQMGRCYVCLVPKHTAKFCKVKGVSCGRRHHQSVCEPKEVQPDVNSNSTAALVSSVSSAMKPKPNEPNIVLLQTVKAWTEGPAGRKIVRCLLDGGSQRSFVHENLVKTLKLPVIKQETLNLHLFGSAGPMTTKCSIVKVVLENMWNTQRRIEIAAVETPQVCTAVMQVPGEHIRREFKRRGLELADFQLDGAEDPEVVLLIGADFYWKVMTGKVERLTESLVGLESTFGWTVQGPVPMSSVTDTTCMHISLEEDTQISNSCMLFGKSNHWAL